MREASARRLEKAARALAATLRDADAGAMDFAAGHVYYAMFYAAEALLAERDLGFSKHGKVHGAFGKEFAQTGVVDPKYHRWLLDAFKLRQMATYDFGVEITAADVRRMIPQAEEFLAAARAYLEKEAEGKG